MWDERARSNLLQQKRSRRGRKLMCTQFSTPFSMWTVIALVRRPRKPFHPLSVTSNLEPNDYGP